jgi:hypothetical protein
VLKGEEQAKCLETHSLSAVHKDALVIGLE